MSKFTGWIPSGDQSGYTIPQAFSDDAKTRLITSLFDLLQQTQKSNSSFFEREIISDFLPTAINAIIAETRDVPQSVKNALAEKVSYVIKRSGFLDSLPEDKRSQLETFRTDPKAVLKVLEKKDFNDFITTIINVDIIGNTENKSSAVKNNLIKAAFKTLETLNISESLFEGRQNDLTTQLLAVFESGALTEPDISTLINTTKGAVQEAIENQVTLVKFDWPEEAKASFEYIETPIPENVLLETEEKLFSYLVESIRESVEACRSERREAWDSVFDTLENALKGTPFEPVVKIASERRDHRRERRDHRRERRRERRDHMRATLRTLIGDRRVEGLSSMSFPIARYVIRENTPLGVTTYNNSDENNKTLKNSLDNFFIFFETYSDRKRGDLDDHTQRTDQDWSLILAIHEAVELGLKAIDDFQEERGSDRFVFLDKLKEKLEEKREEYLLREANIKDYFNKVYSGNSLQFNPSHSITEKAVDAIWVPMTYADEKALKEKASNTEPSSGIRLPSFVDLSDWLPPIVDDHNQGGQGKLNDCTAHAAKTIVEFLDSKKSASDEQKPFKASALFLYKTALEYREALDREQSEAPNELSLNGQTNGQTTEDKGVSIGDIMSVLIRFGVPEEKEWPYPDHTQNEADHRKHLAENPHPSCYMSAREFQISKYFRLDQDETIKRNILLAQIKAVLASGLPCMFGFGSIHALEQTLGDGNIPYLARREGEGRSENTPTDVQGHALVAMGYDDTVGALLVRNSWVNDDEARTPWGKGGYGWLPYEYVLEEENPRVSDCWTLVDWKRVQRKAIAGNFGVRLGNHTRREGQS